MQQYLASEYPINVIGPIKIYLRLFQYGFGGPISNFSPLTQYYGPIWLTYSQNINKAHF